MIESRSIFCTSSAVTRMLNNAEQDILVNEIDMIRNPNILDFDAESQKGKLKTNIPSCIERWIADECLVENIITDVNKFPRILCRTSLETLGMSSAFGLRTEDTDHDVLLIKDHEVFVVIDDFMPIGMKGKKILFDKKNLVELVWKKKMKLSNISLRKNYRRCSRQEISSQLFSSCDRALQTRPWLSLGKVVADSDVDLWQYAISIVNDGALSGRLAIRELARIMGIPLLKEIDNLIDLIQDLRMLFYLPTLKKNKLDSRRYEDSVQRLLAKIDNAEEVILECVLRWG